MIFPLNIQVVNFNDSTKGMKYDTEIEEENLDVYISIGDTSS
jgi:hypothetical protein